MTIRKTPVGRLDDLPRTRLMSGETPLEDMPNMTRHIGTARLIVKRDDLTGLAFGGNKVRQLEYYIGDAKAKGTDTIIITGAIQSNFVRMATAAARKTGMTCHVQLEDRVPKNDPTYRSSGNVLLDKILGATIHYYPHGEDETGADAHLDEIAEELGAKGQKPYIIHLGIGNPPLGALGYVDCAREMLSQCVEQGIELDEVVIASGSGHTQGGLLFGLRALGWQGRVTGVCVRRNMKDQHDRVSTHCVKIADLLGMELVVEDADIILTDEFLGAGYGRMHERMFDAMKLAAETEGLFTDPVYTAKTMCAFIESARLAVASQSLIFVHTGGTPALFAYEKELSAAFNATP